MTDDEAEAAWLEIPEDVRDEKLGAWLEEGCDFTEIERRKKLSLSARRRHQEVDPETGRRAFGGAQPGSGRPRKRRLAERISEAAQEEAKAEKIVQKVFDLLDSEDDRVVLRTITDVVKMEHKEEEIAQRQQELDDKPKDQIIALLAPILARLEESGEIDVGELMAGRAASEVVEGTIVEDGDDGGTTGEAKVA